MNEWTDKMEGGRQIERGKSKNPVLSEPAINLRVSVTVFINSRWPIVILLTVCSKRPYGFWHMTHASTSANTVPNVLNSVRRFAKRTHTHADSPDRAALSNSKQPVYQVIYCVNKAAG